MQDDNTTIRAWLNAVMQQSGLKPTPLARRAGLAPSTILRALDPESGISLERRSIQKIAAALRIAPPVLGSDAVTGFSEPDLAPYMAEDGAPAPDLPANHYRMRVHSRALDLEGFLPGDIATFDMGATPKGGDAVQAQVYAEMGAETVLRVYDPPYLVTRSTDPRLAAKPLLVDGERVRIAAVCIRMERVMR